jgi:peptidoglycan LD-endopeptidase LytH
VAGNEDRLTRRPLGARLALAAGMATAGLAGLLATALLGVVAGAGSLRAHDDHLACLTSSAGSDAIPASLLPLYERAATSYRLGGRGVFVLAAINRVETNFGRNVAVSSAGAVGWMQFMPATWARYGTDGNGDGHADPNEPADAIPSAASYLAASGAPRDWYRAIFAYNHADWYVRDVIDFADRYQGACDLSGAAPVEQVGEGGLAWPVSGPVTSPFGQRWGRLHAGIDIGAPTGTPVIAPAEGLVTASEWAGGYGNRVCLRHSQRLTTCSAHLSTVLVQRGDTVPIGRVIGLVGCTGHCFGDHLHFEVRLGPEPTSEPVDPLPYLEGRTA